MTRRSFLAASLALAGGALGSSARPRSAGAAAPAPGRLALYNIHTRETLDVTFRDGRGRYDAHALRALDHLLRCHYTGEATRMDVAVIEFLAAVDRTLGGDREIHVISGFRSRAYNEWLIRHGHDVAARSLHVVGRAIDVRFPGIALADVHGAALTLHRGGVGYYPSSAFVHVDSGRVRSW